MAAWSTVLRRAVARNAAAVVPANPASPAARHVPRGDDGGETGSLARGQSAWWVGGARGTGQTRLRPAGVAGGPLRSFGRFVGVRPAVAGSSDSLQDDLVCLKYDPDT